MYGLQVRLLTFVDMGFRNSYSSSLRQVEYIVEIEQSTCIFFNTLFHILIKYLSFSPSFYIKIRKSILDIVAVIVSYISMPCFFMMK